MALNIVGPGTLYADTLTDVTQKAILKNPDVMARWHTFNSSVEEVQGARAGYYPRVDVTANTGVETKGGVSASTPPSFSRSNAKVELTQMLWDGFATRDEVRRLNHAQLARHYELLDATENVALDAVRSYNDVIRNRELYTLTEENYVYHRTVFEQIQNKVKAGVGRKVDLEQISGRVALAESNLVNDKANVHDVSARYQRVIGELPPKVMAPPASMAKLVPLNAYDAHLSLGLDASPAILAAIENIRSAQSDLEKGKGKYQPRLDLHLSQSKDLNTSGIAGVSSDKVAELTLTWNLFNGGADVSRTRQNFEHVDIARGQRDSACRNVRQTLQIAYNDVWKLTEQLSFLEQHQLAIEKARTAYQKQFDIGQRSLLDLLDTENELYQAKRAYINGRYDLNVAYARTLAAMGKLVGSMGLTNLEAPGLPSSIGGSFDAPENCPAEAPIVTAVDKDELNLRAAEIARKKIQEAALMEARREAEAARNDADAAEAAKFAAEAAKIESEYANKPGSKAAKPVPSPKPSGAAAPTGDASKFAAEAAAAAKFASGATKPSSEAAKLAEEAAMAAKFAGAASAKPGDASSKPGNNAASTKPVATEPDLLGEDSKFAAEAAAAAKFAGAASGKPADVAPKPPATPSLAKPSSPEDAAKATPLTPMTAPTGVILPELMIERWLKDWESKNADAYLAHYDSSFHPGGGKSRQEWEADRRGRMNKYKTITLRMDNVDVVQQSSVKVTVFFTLITEINGKKDVIEKQLDLIRDGKNWFIQEEKSLKNRAARDAIKKAIPVAKADVESMLSTTEAMKALEALKAEKAAVAAKMEAAPVAPKDKIAGEVENNAKAGTKEIPGVKPEDIKEDGIKGNGTNSKNGLKDNAVMNDPATHPIESMPSWAIASTIPIAPDFSVAAKPIAKPIQHTVPPKPQTLESMAIDRALALGKRLQDSFGREMGAMPGKLNLLGGELVTQFGNTFNGKNPLVNSMTEKAVKVVGKAQKRIDRLSRSIANDRPSGHAPENEAPAKSAPIRKSNDTNSSREFMPRVDNGIQVHGALPSLSALAVRQHPLVRVLYSPPEHQESLDFSTIDFPALPT